MNIDKKNLPKLPEHLKQSLKEYEERLKKFGFIIDEITSDDIFNNTEKFKKLMSRK